MTDVPSPHRHARLLGAYWLDSPVLPHDHCVCCESLALPVGRNRWARGAGGRGLRLGVAVAVLVIAAALTAMAPL